MSSVPRSARLSYRGAAGFDAGEPNAVHHQGHQHYPQPGLDPRLRVKVQWCHHRGKGRGRCHRWYRGRPSGPGRGDRGDAGPKYSAWLRRWLDPRAAFEGVWVQDVFEAKGDNAIGIFSLDYERERDSFAVSGRTYSANGRQWAKFNSTHMFIDRELLKATYRWEGEVLDGRSTPEADKSGLTELELRIPPVLSLPMTGDGRVLHVGESRRIRFQLHLRIRTGRDPLLLPPKR